MIIHSFYLMFLFILSNHAVGVDVAIALLVVFIKLVKVFDIIDIVGNFDAAAGNAQNIVGSGFRAFLFLGPRTVLRIRVGVTVYLARDWSGLFDDCGQVLTLTAK